MARWLYRLYRWTPLWPIYNVVVLNFLGGRAKVVDDPDEITWSWTFLENRLLREMRGTIERIEMREMR